MVKYLSVLNHQVRAPEEVLHLIMRLIRSTAESAAHHHMYTV